MEVVTNGWICRNDWISFFCVSFSFWDQMKWFLFIKVIEMTMKWISNRMMDLFESHNQSQTEKNVISINLSFDLIVYLTLIHSSLNSNKCEDMKRGEWKQQSNTNNNHFNSFLVLFIFKIQKKNDFFLFEKCKL